MKMLSFQAPSLHSNNYANHFAKPRHCTPSLFMLFFVKTNNTYFWTGHTSQPKEFLCLVDSSSLFQANFNEMGFMSFNHSEQRVVQGGYRVEHRQERDEIFFSSMGFSTVLILLAKCMFFDLGGIYCSQHSIMYSILEGTRDLVYSFCARSMSKKRISLDGNIKDVIEGMKGISHNNDVCLLCSTSFLPNGSKYFSAL